MMNKNPLLSQKQIQSKDRLIFALDVPNTNEARKLVKLLGDSVSFYKIGLELFVSGGYKKLVKWLIKKNKKVFVDLKLFDVPQTVGSAVKQLRKYGATFATVHGNDNMLAAAVAEKGDLNILAVTVLTSLGKGDVEDLGFKADVKDIVLSRARRALQLGCNGVISSGLEAAELRRDLGEHFLIITPGIRPVDNCDDQKRTVNVEQAFANGADYIVVGRPIKNAHNPKKAADAIQQTIAKIFQ